MDDLSSAQETLNNICEICGVVDQRIKADIADLINRFEKEVKMECAGFVNVEKGLPAERGEFIIITDQGRAFLTECIPDPPNTKWKNLQDGEKVLYWKPKIEAVVSAGVPDNLVSS